MYLMESDIGCSIIENKNSMDDDDNVLYDKIFQSTGYQQPGIIIISWMIVLFMLIHTIL